DNLSLDKEDLSIDEVWIPELTPEGSPQRLRIVVRGGRVASVSWNDQAYPDLIGDSLDDWFDSHDYRLRGALGVWSQLSTTFYEPRFRRLETE
ncbi:MAG: hypothetical protein ACKPKO_55815, partial [Candidatus Fonsibacter sp.]